MLNHELAFLKINERIAASAPIACPSGRPLWFGYGYLALVAPLRK